VGAEDVNAENAIGGGVGDYFYLTVGFFHGAGSSVRFRAITTKRPS